MNSQPNLFGLLIGISEYPFPIPPLQGCTNDVKRIGELIKELFPKHKKSVKTLLNKKAMRDNVIQGFKTHLCLAKDGDIAWFHFSGHGSLRPSAIEFVKSGLCPNEMDETLVCYDSRSLKGADLADKEIAVLVAEVASSGARVILTFDCCHSGGITRKWGNGAPPSSELFRSRQLPASNAPLQLTNYLDGYYSELKELSIPESPHIAFSACCSFEGAFESSDGFGIFTKHLIHAFHYLGPDPILYELHDFVRSKVIHQLSSSPFSQTPHLELYGGLDAASTIFSNQFFEAKIAKRVNREGCRLTIPLGPMEGLKKGQKLILLNEKEEKVDLSTVKEVGMDKSELSYNTDFTGILFVIPPSPLDQVLRVCIDLSEKIKKMVFPKRKEGRGFKLVESTRDSAEFEIKQNQGEIHLCQIYPKAKLKVVKLPFDSAWESLKFAFEKIVRWRRGKRIQGQIPLSHIQFYFRDPATNHDIRSTYLSVPLKTGERKKIHLMGQNLSNQPLYFTLLNFFKGFGIQTFPSILVPLNSPPFIIYGQGKNHHFYLPPEFEETTDSLRLLVTKEEPVWSLLGQRAMGVRAMWGAEPIVNSEWGFKDLRLKLSTV